MQTLHHYKSAGDAVQKLHIETSHAILDIGCGDGYHLRLAHHGIPRISVAFDIDFASLKNCAQHFSSERPPHSTASHSFVSGDALILPFNDRSFDRVICSLVLYLLPLRQAMTEIHRVLKPGGKVYLRVPMLAWGHAISVFKEISRAKMFAYSLFHVLNGVYFSIFGRQCDYSPTQACYLPRRRFEETAREVGFQFQEVQVDRSRPQYPSIDAWLQKAEEPCGL